MTTPAEHLEPVLSTVLPTDSPTKEEFAVGVALERRDVSVAELNWFEGRALGHPKDFAKVANLLRSASVLSTHLQNTMLTLTCVTQ